MTTLAHFLGQVIGLALIPAAIIWWLRGTRPGRVVWRAGADLTAWRRNRHAEAQRVRAEVAYEQWAGNLAWWGWYRSQHQPGSVEFELATTVIGNLENTRPPRSTRP